MTRTYHPKYLDDGTENPRYRTRTRARLLPDGTENPAYRSRARSDATRERGRDTHARRERSKWATARFVAWDGEGFAIEQRHEYALLCNSLGLALGDGTRALGTEECLHALVDGLRRTREPRTHVAFYFDYDVNMIVRDMGRMNIERLWNGEWTRWRGFALQYRARHSLCISRTRTVDGIVIRESGTLWDVGGFFQSSFVRALESYDVCGPTEIEAIRAMKAQRSTFDPSAWREIVAYCQHECALLVTLCERLRSNFTAAGLLLRRWDGAGAAASALLERERVHRHRARPAPYVEDAACGAYYGGRVEQFRFGHLAPRANGNARIWQYDIRSAYPAALQHVPCLAHARWDALEPESDDEAHTHTIDPFSLYYVEWKYDAYGLWYPFPWRAPDGSVYFPPRGRGWVWGVEMDAARAWERAHRLPLAKSATILAVNRFVPLCHEKPFAFIPHLYRQRAIWKAERNGAEKALKLALNSLYGKCAQRKSYAGGKAPRPPRTHQIEWAGWTTAATRAALLRAGLGHESHLIACATDSLFATHALDGLDTSETLGAWEHKVWASGTFVQSGVYWLDDARGHTAAYSRGFDAASIARDAVIAGWERGMHALDATETRFIGMGSCVHASADADIWNDWRQWITAPRRLTLFPFGGKRDVVPHEGRATGRNPAHGLCATVATETDAIGWMSGGESTQLSLPWRDGGTDTLPTVESARAALDDAEWGRE